MGSRNAQAVFTHWADLDDRSFRLAVHIALISLDKERKGQPARRYYGGRRAMAEALFGRIPSDAATDTFSVFRLRAIYTATSRTTGRLIAAGVLKVVGREAPNRHREYELIIERNE